MSTNLNGNNGATLNHDTHYFIQCPKCNKCVKVHIKGESTVKVLSNCSGGVILHGMDISYNFKCPTCNTVMTHYRDTINRINSIVENMLDNRIIVHTYIPPKYKGVKVVNEMLVDEYDYPTFALINEESDEWTEKINLIETIMKSSPFAKMFDVFTHMGGVKGACFIKLNETNFNEYFVSLHIGMHEFIRVSENYFFDGLDYLASQLEDIYNFDHKDEK